VDEVFPQRGSLEGGTRLTIRGTGFSRGGVQGSTTVFVGPNVCDTIEYYTTDTQIVCVTRAHPSSQTVDIRVSLVAIEKSDFAACPSYVCRFTYSGSYTPSLSWMYLGTTAGAEVSFGGNFRSIGDPNAFTMRIGDAVCQMDDENNNPNLLESIDGNVPAPVCVAPETTAGRYQVSLDIRDDSSGRGLATVSPSVQRVALDSGEEYHTTVYPSVQSVSQHASGVLGGEELVVRGTGFSPTASENEVRVAGVACPVTFASRNELRCKVPAAGAGAVTAEAGANQTAPALQLRAAGTGLRMDILYSYSGDRAPDKQMVFTSGLHEFRDYWRDYYRHVVHGVFVPPMTTNYTFFALSDDLFELEMSTSGDPAQLERVVYNPGYTWFSYQRSSSESRRLELEEGRPYLLRAWHREGGGGDWFRAGVRIEGAAQHPLLRSKQSASEVLLVSTSSDVVREVQEVRLVGASGGRFRLRAPASGATTDELGHDASTNDVDVAVQGLSGLCGSVTVDKAAYEAPNNATGTYWRITFHCAHYPAYQLLEVVNVDLRSDGTQGQLAWEVVLHQEPSELLSGTFRLRYKDTWTDDISYNTGSYLGTQLQAAMWAAGDTQAEVNVYRTAGAAGWSRSWYVEIKGVGRVPALANDTSQLSGPGAELSIEVLRQGSLDDVWYEVVPGDFLQSGWTRSVVTVRTRGLLAACEAPGSLAFDVDAGVEGGFGVPTEAFDPTANVTSQQLGCTFEYLESRTPQLASVEPSEVTVGSELVVRGSGFAPADERVPDGEDRVGTVAQTVVLVGETPCTVRSGNESTLVCRVEHGVSGNWTVRVLVPGGRGWARLSAAAESASWVSTVVYRGSVSSVWPLQGSEAGGTTVRVSGTGFVSWDGMRELNGWEAEALKVRVGAGNCTVVRSTHSWIECLTPSMGDAGARNATVWVGGHAQSGAVFEYSSDATPVVHGVHPARFSSAVTTQFNVSGQLLTANASRMSVTIGGRECVVQEACEAWVSCYVLAGAEERPANAQASEAVRVMVAGLGLASLDGAGAQGRVERALRVTQVGPRLLSLGGGSNVTLSGAGFDVRSREHTRVWFEGVSAWGSEVVVLCDVYQVSFEEVSCALREPWLNGSVVEERDANGTLLARRWVASLSPVSGKFHVETSSMVVPCAGDGSGGSACDVTLSPDATPIVESVWPRVVSRGSLLEINGTGLAAGEVTVFVGDAVASVVESSGSHRVVVSVPEGMGGPRLVRVLVGSAGLAYVAGNETRVEYAVRVMSQDRHSVSAAGGAWVEVGGDGFPEEDVSRVRVTVRAGGEAWSARVVHTAHDKMVVELPGGVVKAGVAPGATVGVNVTYDVSVAGPSSELAVWQLLERLGAGSSSNHAQLVPTSRGHAWATDSASCEVDGGCQVWYNPSASHTAVVRGSWPGEGVEGTEVHLWGRGFGEAQCGNCSVRVGGVECAVESWNDTDVRCRLGGVETGVHRVEVVLGASGRGMHVAGSAEDPGALASVGVEHTLVSRFEVGQLSSTTRVGSVGGGHLLRISGRGFPSVAGHADSARARLAVRLCNDYCDVEWSRYNEVACRTRATYRGGDVTSLEVKPGLLQMGTWAGLPWSGELKGGTSGLALGGQVSGAGGHWLYAVDGDLETSFSSGDSSCHVLLDFGPDSLAWLFRVRLYATFQQSSLLRGSVVEVSVNGSHWVEVWKLETAHEGWNVLEVEREGSARFEVGTELRRVLDGGVRYLRWSRGDASLCLATELQVFGTVLAATATVTGGTSDVVCNATVEVLPEDTAAGAHSGVERGVAQGSYRFEESVTPRVTSVWPRNGTALGGTEVTLEGSGFPTSSSEVSVRLNGVECDVVSSTSSSVRCVTRARDEVRPLSVEVEVSGVGLAAAVGPQASFRYLDRWSWLTTWRDQEPPRAGDSVVIPAGQTVLLDVSPPELFLLLVQGELVFDRRDGLSLDATYIIVHGGVLEIGTEEEPYLNDATITLHGDRLLNVHVPHLGVKMIALMDRVVSSTVSRGADGSGEQGHEEVGTDNMVEHAHSNGHGLEGTNAIVEGRLDIHGRPRRRVWTKLAQTAAVGSRQLVLAEDVDFEPGDLLVVTSSSVSFAEAEEVVVESVQGPRELTLRSGLRYTHESTVEWILGERVDMRVEVGLVSRNVVIQGDDRSESQLFGAHTIAAHGGRYLVENAEFRRCGQAGILGRYCTHTHMVGEHSHSYVRYNSIHHSFQRACTVHGALYFTVKHNFAYHVMGHTFFVEDGAEFFNVIEENLGAVTLRQFLMLKGDTKPATFWMSSPTQFWRHNVAAGCTNDGFWFELPSHPHGPSFTTSICPVHGHVGEFFNNTAHSNGVHGLRIYPVYLPRRDPCDESSGPAPQYFTNFTAWHNGVHGVFGKENGDLHHVNAKLVENVDDELFWTKLHEVEYGWNPHLKDVLAVASRRALSGGAEAGAGKHAVMAPQNEFFLVSGLRVVNYGSSPGALAGCAKCGTSTDMKQGGYTFRWERLEFHNSSRRTHWTPPRKQIFWDLDGSLTGHVNGTATPFYAFNEWPACTRGGPAYDDGLVCDGSTRVRRLRIDGVEPSALDFRRLSLTSAAGVDSVAFLPKEHFGWVLPVVHNHEYRVVVGSELAAANRADWREMQIQLSEVEYVESGEWLRLAFPYQDTRYHFQVEHVGSQREVPWIWWDPANLREDVVPWTRRPTPADAIGTGSIHQANKTWYVILDTVNATVANPSLARSRHEVHVSALQCPLSGCPAPPPAVLGNESLWSDPQTWPSGSVPLEGEDVVIDATMHVILDVNPPRLGSMVVEGKLEFQRDRDTTLRCGSITVWGSMEVGTPDAPYEGQAVIEVDGRRSDPSVLLDNSVFVGNKVVAVAGSLVMQGRTVARPWVSLASTASAGSMSVELSESVADWGAGSEVVLTGTGYNTSEEEVVTVVSMSNGNRRLQLSAPLRHTHFSGVVSSGAHSVRLASKAGLLTRNVVLRSRMHADEAGFGAHVTAVAFQRPAGEDGSPGKEYRGRVELRYVQLEGMGKLAQEHGAVNLDYGRRARDANTRFPPRVSPPPQSVVHGCAFSNLQNSGVMMYAARSSAVTWNVLHNARTSGVDVDASTDNVTLSRNLVVGVRRTIAAQTWTVPFSGLMINNAAPFEVEGNVVAGSDHAGLTFRGDLCTGDVRVRDNEVVGSVVGAFLLTGMQAPCLRVSRLTAWLNSHVGLLTVAQRSDVVVEDVVLSDNHEGITLDFFRSVVGAKAVVRRAVVLGTTAASGSASGSGRGCMGSSVRCRAMTATDVWGESGECGSVFGNGVRRVGVVIPQFTNRGKTCEVDSLPVCRPPNLPERMCSMSWEKRYGLPSTPRATFEIENSTFGHFSASDCGLQSVAIASNPSQVEYTPPVFLREVRFSADAEQAAWFKFHSNVAGDPKCESSCDGTNFIVVTDEDGMVTGSARSTITGNNPTIGGTSEECTARPEWGGFVCDGLQLRGVVFESRDGDRGFRRLGTLQIARMINDGTNRTSFSKGPSDDGCAKRFYFASYPFVLGVGRDHEVLLFATQPKRMRWHFNSPYPEEKALVSLFIQDPMEFDVFFDGQRMESLGRTPTIADPPGSFAHDPQARRLKFVLGGGESAQPWLDIRQTPKVQLTLKLAVTVEEFFGERLVQNLATLLGIPASRIRVVGVQAGSVNVKVEIVDEAEPAANETVAIEQEARLADLATTIEEKAVTGEFDVGFQVEEMVIEAPDPTPPPPPPGPPPPGSNASNDALPPEVLANMTSAGGGSDEPRVIVPAPLRPRVTNSTGNGDDFIDSPGFVVVVATSVVFVAVSLAGLVWHIKFRRPAKAAVKGGMSKTQPAWSAGAHATPSAPHLENPMYGHHTAAHDPSPTIAVPVASLPGPPSVHAAASPTPAGDVEMVAHSASVADPTASPVASGSNVHTGTYVGEARPAMRRGDLPPLRVFNGQVEAPSARQHLPARFT